MTMLANNEPNEIQKIEKFSSHISGLLKRFKETDIDSEVECDDNLKLVKDLKDLSDKIDLARKEITYDSREFISKINEGAKALISQLDDLEDAISCKILGWLNRIEKEALETKNKAIEVSKQLNLSIPVLSSEKVGIRSQYMTVSKKTTLDHEIMDEMMVPLEYLSVDQEKIKKAVKAGIRHIEGVRIFENETVQFRRKS